jgi:hypothetical protein
VGLARFFKWARQAEASSPTFNDPILGEWRLIDGFWTSSRARGEQRIELTVGGKVCPNPELAKAALLAFERLDDLQSQLDRQFSELVASCPGPVPEKRLVIESICFTVQPSHGMAFLAGGCDWREWHCDLIDLNVRHLAADT